MAAEFRHPHCDTDTLDRDADLPFMGARLYSFEMVNAGSVRGIAMLINHMSLGVSDFGEATAFYDAVLGELGYGRQHEVEGLAVAYGDQWPELWIGLPLDTDRPASAGNGTHVAFTAKDPGAVDGFY